MNATVPAAALAPVAPDGLEQILLVLAREIAMDIHPLDDILKNHEVSSTSWERIRTNPYFIRMLQSQVEEWNSALNTAERVRIKALSCVEEALPEFFASMVDKNENLPARVRALEAFGNLAGMGKNSAPAGGGEKFSVTINISDDKKLTIEAPVQHTIDATDQ